LLKARRKLPLEILLVDNDSLPEDRAEVEKFLPKIPVPVKLLSFPGPFNYARMHNWTTREHAQGNLFLFLNNDVELRSADLDYWAAWAAQPGVATAGSLLRFHHGGVQHAGIRAWFGGESRLVRVGNSHANDASASEFREVFANTFAACLVKREAFEAVGGLREKDLVNGFGDVAFCFECVKQGWKHYYLGAIEGVHAESSSRGQTYEYWEEFGLEREYPALLQKLLREDAGRNRVPGAEASLFSTLGFYARAKFRRNSKWLNPLKPLLKKWLRNTRLAGDNG
jgi:GT2 family glycosyltransferase